MNRYGDNAMKTCPICKSPYQGHMKQCNRCGLNLDWVKWRSEGLIAIGLGIGLILIGIYLTSYAVWHSDYNGLFFQSYATYPYSGMGVLSLFVGAIVLIAGIASAIVYDFKISHHSHRTG